MTVTRAEISLGVQKAKDLFDDREDYKFKLRAALEKYGFNRLPESIKTTVPADIKTLYEPNWRLIPSVRITVMSLGREYAENKRISEVVGWKQ